MVLLAAENTNHDTPWTGTTPRPKTLEQTFRGMQPLVNKSLVCRAAKGETCRCSVAKAARQREMYKPDVLTSAWTQLRPVAATADFSHTASTASLASVSE